MTAIIEAHGLTKRFGDVEALAGLDLVAETGHVTALLGPNGAGKTTFVSAVATLLRPDAGELRVAGIDVAADPRRVRRIIGLAGPVRVGRARDDGPREPRTRRAAVRPRPARGPRPQRPGARAHGPRRRRRPAGAHLLGRDAPAPRPRREPRRPAPAAPPRRAHDRDSTPGVGASCGTRSATSSPTASTSSSTTQYLEEADQLAREIVIVDRGHVIDAGTPDELKDRAGRDVIEVETARSPVTSPRSRRSSRPSRPRRPARHRHAARVGRRRRRHRAARDRREAARRTPHRARRHRFAPSVARRGVPHADRSVARDR